jgi:uncharacterized radical SAM protein YgiQ
MAEKSILELAHALKHSQPVDNLRGLCYPASLPPASAIELPSYQEVKKDILRFEEMFRTFYRNNDPIRGQCLVQRQDNRYLIQNPPADLPTTQELDAVYELPFLLAPHPLDAGQGTIKALETIRFGITTHRGCYGECNFCAIAVHQGRTVTGRSRQSILREAERMTNHPEFKGVLLDVGGPTANMYGFECTTKKKKGACPTKRCLFPVICPSLKIDHTPQIDLLRALRNIPTIRQVRVASGIRYDMILADRKNGIKYLRELVRHHIGGQLKIAPEHSEKRVLDVMGKPDSRALLDFRSLFQDLLKKENKENKLFLTYYMIAAHPGCRQQDMQRLQTFCRDQLGILPRQVQLFTPSPSTWSTTMYHTCRAPGSGKPLYVEKKDGARKAQVESLLKRGKRPPARARGER